MTRFAEMFNPDNDVELAANSVASILQDFAKVSGKLLVWQRLWDSECVAADIGSDRSSFSSGPILSKIHLFSCHQPVCVITALAIELPFFFSVAQLG